MADVLKVAQLLLVQPSDTAVLAFRVACLAAGTAAPAWIAYKAAQAEASPKAKDRALRLAMAAALVELGEKALGAPVGLPRWRYWPSAKLALLLWLLLDGGKGADHVYAFVSRAMAPYEAEVDSVVDTAGPLLQHAAAR
ncbi:hypothetical protein MNEG_2037 [Monoraphidium neglectum]|uniref:HVA22-like protein n=1 Tax=Monoraphidium neglectum TaxID=145388 RepID=A0A0D2N038_9CHLO|nr:hypothetical protein MNEG_2037 [Monoraphidium neglectum]KIZ05922.1 hypothetical protein MNEG_2037 [Monoraphidium neglectum]|eukprot:XP_013904941.1 hypothetical protein MNEG_2037 [Monoraphidium neglectum]